MVKDADAMIEGGCDMDQAYALSQGNILLSYLLSCVTQGKPSDIKSEFAKPEYPNLAQSYIGNDLSTANIVFGFVLPQGVRTAINGGMSWQAANTIYFKYLKRSQSIHSAHEMMELLNQMFLEFAEGVAHIRESYNYSPLVRRCRFYIDEHIYEALSVQRIASALDISIGHLSRTHKKETGESISGYIRRKKIAEAKWLLVHSSFSVTHIYSKLGYCSQSYFTDIFRKEAGMTPCSFRLAERPLACESDKTSIHSESL
jgi:AraC-like DNA-binding protein